MKLAQKFTLALVMIMLITVSARTYFDTERRIDQHVETIRASQRLLGDVLSASVDTIWRAKGWEAALAFLRQVEKQQGSTEIRWTWLTEQPLSEYTPRVSLSRLRKLSQGEPRIEIDRSEGRGYVISYLRVELLNHPLGAIELTRSTTSEEQYAGEERNQQIATSALVILAFAMIASVLGRGLVGEPINELIEHAKRVGAGDFTNLAVVRSGDEIGTLAQEMNSMSERLRRAREKASKERKLRLEVEAQLTHADRLASVGRLTASVVQDMGTPLNVISGRAMMIMESGDASEEIKNNSQRIADQSERIAGMLRQLLTYARKDAGAKEERRC